VATESAGGCDYLMFGTVFPSLSKPFNHPIAGTAALAEVCAAVALPVLAIGGVTPSRALDLSAAGAAGVAAIGYFADARDPASAVASFQSALTDPRGRV
jgi:thiamine monophosphate synthase